VGIRENIAPLSVKIEHFHLAEIRLHQEFTSFNDAGSNTTSLCFPAYRHHCSGRLALHEQGWSR
jgi:hypothetical protein